LISPLADHTVSSSQQ